MHRKANIGCISDTFNMGAWPHLGDKRRSVLGNDGESRFLRISRSYSDWWLE